MKFIIIGLGTLGYTMARLLTEQGEDVIGVDENLSRVEEYKDDMSSTICLNVSEYHALESLPIKDVDGVIVTIGDNLSTSIEVVAYMKQLGAKKIYARSTSPVQTAILNAIGIDLIMKPSEYAAEMYSFDVSATGILGLYPIDETYRIYQIYCPEALTGHLIKDIHFQENFNIRLITLKRQKMQRNFFGKETPEYCVLPDWNENTTLEKNDILVLLGDHQNFARMKKTLS